MKILFHEIACTLHTCFILQSTKQSKPPHANKKSIWLQSFCGELEPSNLSFSFSLVQLNKVKKRQLTSEKRLRAITICATYDNNLKITMEGGSPHAVSNHEQNRLPYGLVQNVIILLMGLATLSSPYAIAQSGYSGVLICGIVAFLYYHSTTLMLKSMDTTGASSYVEIARAAFPRWGHPVSSWLFYFETAGTLVGFFISIGDMSYGAIPQLSTLKLKPFTGRDISMLASCVIILPMIWTRKLAIVSHFSTICNFSLVAIIGCVLYTGITIVGFHHRPQLVHWRGVLDAFGIFSFAFGATPVYPNLYASTGKSSRFIKMVFCSFITAVSIYVLLGIGGAMMFGSKTSSLITTSLPAKLPATEIANWLGLIIPITKFPILILPIFEALDEVVPSKVFNIILRSAIILALLIIASFFPYFPRVIELVGSSLTILLCSILPNAFYLKICRQTTTSWEKFGIYLTTIISIIIAITCTIHNFMTIA